MRSRKWRPASSVRTSSDCKASRAMLSSRNAWRIGTIRAAQRLPEPSTHPSNSAKTCGQSRAAHPHQERALITISGRPFPFFGCLGHALKKDGRAFYWRRFTGTINFSPPGLLGSSSSLHDERIVRWVKFITHTLLHGDGRLKFQTGPLIIGWAVYGFADDCDSMTANGSDAGFKYPVGVEEGESIP